MEIITNKYLQKMLINSFKNNINKKMYLMKKI